MQRSQSSHRTGLERSVRRNMVLASSIPLLLVVIAISVYMAWDKTSEFRKGLAEAAGKSAGLVESEIESVYVKSDMILQNRYLIQALQTDYVGDIASMMPLYENLELLIAEPLGSRNRSFFTVYPYNESIYEGSFVERYDRIADRGIADRLQVAGAGSVYWSDRLHERPFRGNARYVQFYREIKNFNESIGILEANISFEQLTRIINNTALPDSAALLVADGTGKVVYARNSGPTLTLTEAGAFDPAGYHTAIRQLNPALTIVAAVPKSVITAAVSKLVGLIVIIFVVALFIMQYVASYSARTTLSILKRFLDTLKTDERHWAEKFEAVGEDNEIDMIKRKFLQLLERMNQMHEETIQANQERGRFELELLQARINPHLLYNSLSVIKWNAQWNKDRRTALLIDHMSKYYRASLSKGNTVITVGEELAMVRDYVQINEFSYNCSYELKIEAEEDVGGMRIFKHMLQPIVENAILHGLNAREGGGTIQIAISRRRGEIRFAVSDDGSGMSQDKIAQILDLQAVSSSPGGYGMKNLIRRIAMYFGPQAALEIASEPDRGTTVTIILPEEAFNGLG
ncbi:hypothetical protein B1748_21745 [Paenibacillus sp. MY03]|uniref:sensor histidine kinase n=1 Tax=Paenibacillus sp. MY03 TaxID=302980 RepID=UPI000B3CC233|nr:histidine kinase [Paenibacillus sp. MY03]OUS73969.1 hypothetical protein B1748_21745 [Paenibacillus sp. MY03]